MRQREKKVEQQSLGSTGHCTDVTIVGSHSQCPQKFEWWLYM